MPEESPEECPRCGHAYREPSKLKWWLCWLFRRNPRWCTQQVADYTVWGDGCGCGHPFHDPLIRQSD